MIIDFAKKTLAWPVVYDTYQSLVGMPECHRRFVQDIMRLKAGERVLDVGCGVGASLRYVPETVDYVGIDLSDAYVAKARADYGHRAKFICADVTTLDAAALGTFDRAFSVGVLHHLSDDDAAQVVEFVRRVVKPGGTYLTLDPCYVPGQHPIAKLIIDGDRGQYVRDAGGFERLVAGLGTVRSEIHHDLMRIPYTQIVMSVALDRQRGVAADR